VFTNLLIPFFHSLLQKMTFTFSLLVVIFLLSTTAQAKSTTQQAGDILQIAIPLASFASTLIIEDDYQGSFQFIKSAITSELTTLALKKSINEQRPNGVCCDSFPSGHTSAAFMGASFVQFRYGWKYAIPAYAAATLVAYSRVDSNEHYTRDVLAGAAIGVLSSYFFTKKYHHINVTPYAFNNQLGVQVSGTF